MGNCCCKEQADSITRHAHATNENRGGGGGGSRQNFGGGQALGGKQKTGVSARDAAATAAMARNSKKSSGSGGSTGLSEADIKLRERRAKDELIGRIEALYAAKNKDPPIGLAASSMDALRKHLEHMKNDGAER